MKIYSLHRETFLPVSVERAWDFFSLPANLEQITPPGVKFQTLTKLGDQRLRDGMEINYRLRPLMNIPVRWQTVIKDVQPPHRFIDIQVKGPYALWEHTHTFEPADGGVKMTDSIRYALPFGWLGMVFHALIVKKKLDDIFAFRERTVKEFFSAQGPA
jgi:ligand-binding SRPBCC domain-containing protein